jgi:2-dehydropantoate 2-reductase
MRIAVLGTGGIGGPYGASIARAGADVTFVARGAHLAAIRENGLRIEGDRGETHIRPAQATDDIGSIGTVDYVLLCVKLWDVETAGEQIRPIVGPQTAVVPLQNGIDAADRLIPILGPEPVMGGSAFVTGTIVSASSMGMRARAASGSVICALRPASRGSSAPISGCRYGRNSSGWCR